MLYRARHKQKRAPEFGGVKAFAGMMGVALACVLILGGVAFG